MEYERIYDSDTGILPSIPYSVVGLLYVKRNWRIFAKEAERKRLRHYVLF
jgi:hypothetical protein